MEGDIKVDFGFLKKMVEGAGLMIKDRRDIEQANRKQRIAMYDDWIQCDITIAWMPVEKHVPISDCKVFVAMQDGEIRPAYYEADFGFSDGCGECGGLLEPEYWTHSIQSPQGWLEDHRHSGDVKGFGADR